MANFKKLLVCLDPHQESQPALQKAIYLAKAYEASIELFLVVYNRSIVSNLFFNADELENAKNHFIKSQHLWVDSYLAQAVEAGVKVSVDVVWHKPLYEAIVQKVNRDNIDLVIKSTHEHPIINKLFFTPNDWQLLKLCPVPIILTKPETKAQYSNLLVAIDPSHAKEKPVNLDPLILRAGQAVAKQLNLDYHVTHCLDPLSYQLWNDMGIGMEMGLGMGPADLTIGESHYQDYLTQLKESQLTAFEKIIADYNFKDDNKHLIEGYPETMLPELVEKLQIDLLVVGSTYHSGFVGSTAEKILDEIGCDIMCLTSHQSV